MIDPAKYLEFVNAVTSAQSKDHEMFVYRVQELEAKVFIPTIAYCICRYVCGKGEFTEVVKKMVFQGKPVNDENMFHLKRELGDIMWYVAQLMYGSRCFTR